MKIGAALTACFAALIAAAYLFNNAGHAEDSEMIRRTAPAFRLPDLNEESATVSDALVRKGRAAVNVFGSWCGACAQEHPEWIKLRQALPQAVVVGVAWDDDAPHVNAWLARYGGNPYTRVALDNVGDFTAAYGVTGAPETFLIQDGVIVDHIVGNLSGEEMQSVIAPFLAGAKDGK